MINIIVKNNTQSIVIIDNLSGVQIPISGQVDLIGLFSIDRICDSDELKTKILAEDLHQ